MAEEVKRYRCCVSYDGTAYNGWQSQENSIQEKIEEALKKITGQSIRIHGAGRTDAGVHAEGQVFHFDTDKTIKDFKAAINSQLPADIHICSAEAVDQDFHARYSAKGKHYDYLINDGEYNPLWRNHAAYIRKPCNLEKMQKAAQIFVGTHDFSSFNATRYDEIENQVRTIERIEVRRKQGLIIISYYGDGFLRYMVRMISQTLIEIGIGKIDEKHAIMMLEEKSKTACPYNGQPQGLILKEVFY